MNYGQGQIKKFYPPGMYSISIFKIQEKFKVQERFFYKDFTIVRLLFNIEIPMNYRWVPTYYYKIKSNNKIMLLTSLLLLTTL